MQIIEEIKKELQEGELAKIKVKVPVKYVTPEQYQKIKEENEFVGGNDTIINGVVGTYEGANIIIKGDNNEN